MWVDADLRELRQVPDEQRADWVAHRFPDGVPPQWWRAVLVSLENRLNPFRDSPPAQRVADFAFAAEFVELAVDTGGVRAGEGGNWMLGLAVIALRFDRLGRPVPGLPEVVSPDGAAEWALRRISLPHERVIAEAEARRVSPLGVFAELLDVEKVLDALTWVAAHLEREDIAREVHAWLEVRERL